MLPLIHLLMRIHLEQSNLLSSQILLAIYNLLSRNVFCMSLMEWQISDFDTCNFEQIVAAIQRILYAADDSPAVIAEA